jgi:hypothetical protein
MQPVVHDAYGSFDLLRGWDTLGNGALLNAAEDAGFELLLTTDRRIRDQQNLAARRIALVIHLRPPCPGAALQGCRRASVRRLSALQP